MVRTTLSANYLRFKLALTGVLLAFMAFGQAGETGGIETATNFDPKTGSPLDKRTQIASLSDTAAITFPYAGLRTYVVDLDTWYEYNGAMFREVFTGGVSEIQAKNIAEAELQKIVPKDTSLFLDNGSVIDQQVRTAVKSKYPVRLDGRIVLGERDFDAWMRQQFGGRSQVQDSNYVIFPEKNVGVIEVDFPTDECVRVNTTLAEKSTVSTLGIDSFRVSFDGMDQGGFKLITSGGATVSPISGNGLVIDNVTDQTVSFILDDFVMASGGCLDGYRIYINVFDVDRPDVSVEFATPGEITQSGMVPSGDGYVTDPAVTGVNDNAFVRSYYTLRPNSTSTALGDGNPFAKGDTLSVNITGAGVDQVRVQLAVTRYRAARRKKIGGDVISVFSGNYYSSLSRGAATSAVATQTDSLCVATGDTLYVFGDSFTSNFGDEPDWPEMIQEDGVWPLRLVAAPGWWVGRDILPLFRSSIEAGTPGAIIVAAAFNDIYAGNSLFAPGAALANPDYADFFTDPNVNNWRVLAAHIDTMIAISEELYPGVPMAILNCAPVDPYLADLRGGASAANFVRINFERYNNWLVERCSQDPRLHYIDQYSLLSGADYWIESKAQGRLHPSLQFQRIIADYITSKLLEKCD